MPTPTCARRAERRAPALVAFWKKRTASRRRTHLRLELTTYANLDALIARHPFITLRRRSAQLLAEIETLRSAWRQSN